mgnify:CR=1 FL=1
MKLIKNSEHGLVLWVRTWRFPEIKIEGQGVYDKVVGIGLSIESAKDDAAADLYRTLSMNPTHRIQDGFHQAISIVYERSPDSSERIELQV